MNPILLLVENRETQNDLRDWLANQYQVIVPNSQLEIEEPFDICLVDEPALMAYRDWIQAQRMAAAPVFLPVLYLVPRQQVQSAEAYLGHLVDEIMVLPLERIEVQIRLNALFHLRQLSLERKADQERLLRISKAIESTSDAVSIADHNGTALYHNQAFSDLFQFTVNELNVRGIPNSLFVHPHVAHDVFQATLRGQSWSGEVMLKKKNGQPVPVWLRADGIRDDSGHYLGMISVCTDITERRAMEASQLEQRILAEAMRDTTSALTSTLDLDEVLERILSNIERVVPHDSAVILLVEKDTAYVVRSEGLIGRELQRWLLTQRYSIQDTPELREMAETGQPVVVPHISEDWYAQRPAALSHLRSYAGAPIRLKGKTIGFLYLNSTHPGFFTAIHAERLQAFAEQAAIAIQNAQLHEKARALAALEERQRLARELHDAVSQTLFSASILAESLPRLWDRKPEKVRPLLEQLQRLTHGAMAEMRTLLLELRPVGLLEVQLDELLRQLTRAILGQTRIDVTLHLEGQQPVPPEVRPALYYITQEALTNVVKHSRATEASVSLNRQPGYVELSITDNGRGFDLQQVRSGRLGLNIMRERADAIGASIEISSEAGRGTQVRVIWTNIEQKEQL